MAESAKFVTKDLGKEIMSKATPSKLKFENDKLLLEAIVIADDLKEEMKGKDWAKLEKEMQGHFDGLVTSLVTSLAKKIAKADDELSKFPPSLYDNFLRPINIEIERKFEEHAKRIHSILNSDLQGAKKEYKVKQDPKIRVDMDFCCLEASGRRSVSSSSGSAPVVKPTQAGKDVNAAAQDCEPLAKAVDAEAATFKKAFGEALRVPGGVPPKAAEDCKSYISGYKRELALLEKQLTELRDALDEEADKQEAWKKKYSATKPNYSPEDQKKIKTAIDGVIAELGVLVKSANAVRDAVIHDGSKQVKKFESALETMETEKDAMKLAATLAGLRASFVAEKEVGDFLKDVKTGLADVQKGLQVLAKAATAK